MADDLNAQIEPQPAIKPPNNTTENKSAGGDDEDSLVPGPDSPMPFLSNEVLQKRVMEVGKGVDTKPKKGDLVILKVDGRLSDDALVDTGCKMLIMNDGDAIFALESAAADMEVGEKCEILASSNFAYGSVGRQPDIPRDADIKYTLELVKTVSSTNIFDIAVAQRLKLGITKRERGDHLFALADYKGASKSYLSAIDVFENTKFNNKFSDHLTYYVEQTKLNCLRWLAECLIQREEFYEAIEMCKKALKIKEHSKVLFVIGKAYAKLNQIDRALKLQRRALKLDPSSKDILKELCSLTNHKLKELLLERQSLQLMLDSSEVNTPPVRKDASCCKRVRTDISQDDRKNLSSKKARVESLKGENITLLSNIGYMLCGFKTKKVPSETINSIAVTSPRGTVNLNTYANPGAEDEDE